MKTILITIILTLGSQSPSTGVVKDAYRYAHREFKAADVKLQISSITKVREVRAQRLEQAVSRYYYWYTWKNINGIKGRVVAILPRPVNVYDALGLAPVCNKDSLAVINFTKKNPDEIVVAKVAFAHELGHTMGAIHHKSRSIMNPYILKGQYQPNDLPHFLDISIEEIKTCLSKEK